MILLVLPGGQQVKRPRQWINSRGEGHMMSFLRLGIAPAGIKESNERCHRREAFESGYCIGESPLQEALNLLGNGATPFDYGEFRCLSAWNNMVFTSCAMDMRWLKLDGACDLTVSSTSVHRNLQGQAGLRCGSARRRQQLRWHDSRSLSAPLRHRFQRRP